MISLNRLLKLQWTNSNKLLRVFFSSVSPFFPAQPVMWSLAEQMKSTFDCKPLIKFHLIWFYLYFFQIFFLLLCASYFAMSYLIRRWLCWPFLYLWFFLVVFILTDFLSLVVSLTVLRWRKTCWLLNFFHHHCRYK